MPKRGHAGKYAQSCSKVGALPHFEELAYAKHEQVGWACYVLVLLDGMWMGLRGLTCYHLGAFENPVILQGS